MKAIKWNKLGIREAAAAIDNHLRSKGIDATLVGGACVSIYSDNAYESFDLDFVSHEPQKRIESALAELGFHKTAGRHFDHPDCKYYAEFVSPPLAIGAEVVKKLKRIRTPFGMLSFLCRLLQAWLGRGFFLGRGLRLGRFLLLQIVPAPAL